MRAELEAAVAFVVGALIAGASAAAAMGAWRAFPAENEVETIRQPGDRSPHDWKLMVQRAHRGGTGVPPHHVALLPDFRPASAAKPANIQDLTATGPDSLLVIVVLSAEFAAPKSDRARAGAGVELQALVVPLAPGGSLPVQGPERQVRPQPVSDRLADTRSTPYATLP